MTGLAALSQAMGIAKGLRELEKGFDAAEFKLKIAELYSSLADAKMALADAKEAVEAKEQELNQLILQFQVRLASVNYKGYRYEADQNGKPLGFPYCPRCESNGKMMRTTYTGKTRGEASCPECNSVYRYVEDFQYPESS